MSSRESMIGAQRRRSFLVTVCIVGALLGLAQVAGAIDVVVTGDWSRTITTADLVGGIGTDLASSYESASNQVLISISNTTGPGDAWRIDVHRTDGTWSGSLTVSVKRTGTGGGSVAGGAAYQAITTSAVSFFTGSDDVTDIPIQLKLDGMSLQIAPDTYSTTVTITVVDI